MVGLLDIVGLLDKEGSELTLGAKEGVTDGMFDTLGPNVGRVDTDGTDEEGAAEMLG